MKRLLIALTLVLALFACKPAQAQEALTLPFKFDVNTLYDFQHKVITPGLSVDFVSVYDVLYLGVEGIGAVEENFFKNGLLGVQANVDMNQAVTLIAGKLKLGDKVKWLQGKYMPRIGYCFTYNMFQNDYYKQWNHFITLRIASF